KYADELLVALLRERGDRAVVVVERRRRSASSPFEVAEIPEHHRLGPPVSYLSVHVEGAQVVRLCLGEAAQVLAEEADHRQGNALCALVAAFSMNCQRAVVQGHRLLPPTLAVTDHAEEA